ncbi:zinc finger protein 474-like isoform X2 [Hypanus sabinus]|uniref:zinc finger protein 474-like isoform X2 n=1 Tax=Hypanus sabinus TaxID=79690 RepID=UPI0028C454AC|nr:zinc finger protein 474-like isoform X2 [Hypanus sabinus]XP_059825631.1 zinc finger protein 474-like isoform X2 [Hypanus sabinus]
MSKLRRVCYICGKQFGLHSIVIHEPRCLENWRIENKKLPKHKQRPEPKKPQPVKVDGSLDDNVANTALFTRGNAQLIPCKNCGQTFPPDQLSVHQRSCKSTDGGTSSKIPKSSTSYRSPPAVRRPRTVFCYICGREYGTTSISIHEPQCLKKWHIENDQLPKHLRRPEPKKPEVRPIKDAAWPAEFIQHFVCAAEIFQTWLPTRKAMVTVLNPTISSESPTTDVGLTSQWSPAFFFLPF